jgi:thiol-disulfide isomerase/thioredoxin
MSQTNESETISEKQQQRSGRKIPAAAVLFGLMLVFSLVTVVMILQNPVSSQTTVPPGSVLATAGAPNVLNRPAPEIEMRDLEGDVVRLGDYEGNVVFLNFWWSGCPPCVEELPDLEAFAQAQADNNVVVVSVNTVDSPERIQEFLRENEITLETVHVLRDVEETSYEAVRSLGVSVYPTTYLVDAEQNIKKVKFGILTTEEMNSYLSEVGSLAS